jgi:hypothetical protein
MILQVKLFRWTTSSGLMHIIDSPDEDYPAEQLFRTAAQNVFSR